MITKLNIDAIKDGSILHSKLADSEYFKTFETEEEYITAKESELLDPSCVVYISSEDRFIFPKKDDGSYNAIITISETYMVLSSQVPEPNVILINPSYLDLLEIDGEDYLSNVSYVEGLGECVKLEDAKLGDVFHVRFKLRDDLSVIMDPDGDGQEVGLFYACLSYLEVDESLFKATVKDTSTKVPISFLVSSVGPEVTYRFVGDCLFQDPNYFSFFIENVLYIIAMMSSMAGTQGCVTFQIPENNNTYGNIEDTTETWTEGSPIFCALINLYKSEYENSEDASLVINLETY
jgi:hypothetical protein